MNRVLTVTNRLLSSSRNPAAGSLRWLSSPTAGANNSVDNEDVHKRIKEYVQKDKVVVFMKGTQKEPMCGFSRNVKLVGELCGWCAVGINNIAQHTYF